MALDRVGALLDQFGHGALQAPQVDLAFIRRVVGGELVKDDASHRG